MDVWQPAVMLLPCVSSADCQSDKTDKMPENTTFTVLMGDGNDILLFFCLFFFLFLLCQKKKENQNWNSIYVVGDEGGASPVSHKISTPFHYKVATMREKC